MYIYIYVCMYVYIYLHIYIYIHTINHNHGPEKSQDMKTWPSRDSILEMCVACGERHGLDEKTRPGMLASWGWDKTCDSLSHDISLNYWKNSRKHHRISQNKQNYRLSRWIEHIDVPCHQVVCFSQVQHLAGEIGGEGRHLEWGALCALATRCRNRVEMVISWCNGYATNDELASGF